ncbi:vegetative cell wall protein gp1-like [Monomorium pharaonis]|uniref:vegetative cell wall protein gp1-like n=1 Tax=Monomorium pharaonis TaxID=307658 RepID=UPI00063EF26F|nr:vegetative cell wall protein gp1-like [Monomorium pharaonis]
MSKQRSTLHEKLARAIARPPRIPTSNRPFEASLRPPARNERRNDGPPSTTAPAPAPSPTPPSGPRLPAVARERTICSRQERLYAETSPAADNGQSVLLATFGFTLSDLNDDDNGESTTASEERPMPAPMPDIESLCITEPATATSPASNGGPAPTVPPLATTSEPAPQFSFAEAPQQAAALSPPSARPPSAAAKATPAAPPQPPLPTPPPTPPATPGYFIQPQPIPTPISAPTGYFTQPPHHRRRRLHLPPGNPSSPETCSKPSPGTGSDQGSATRSADSASW